MLTESHFHAPWWARNPHLQTILPKWLRRTPARFVAQRFELQDGDFVDLAWSGEVSLDERPLVVVFHGLEGAFTPTMPRDCSPICNERAGKRC